MRIWLVGFGVLFAIAEIYQWAEHLSLPLPIYILGGVFLAIASNNKQLGLFLQSSGEPSVIGSSNSPWDNLSSSHSNATSQSSSKSISFTINRLDEQNGSDEK